MKTQYYTATSVDGYIADPDDSLDWLFQFEDGSEVMTEVYPAFITQVGALAMGSTTYRWMLEHESLIEHPEKWTYEVPCWVFTTRDLPAVEGADIRFVRGDVAPVHAEMTRVASERNIWIVGGGELVGRFYDAGLLDELILFVTSVTLGAGAPLLPRRITTPPLRLTHVQRHGEAFVELRYDVRRSDQSRDEEGLDRRGAGR